MRSPTGHNTSVLVEAWRAFFRKRLDIALLLAILGFAAALRLTQLGTAPPGPHHDEAAAALDAIDLLNGQPTVFSPRSYGREMLFVYVLSPLVALLGPTLLALRLPSAMVGILSVLATYLLARELFSSDNSRQARSTGLLAALFLTLSFWHLVANHLTFRANYVPLIGTLCFLFLWRAVRTNRWRDYITSGLLLGLSLHTYAAARFVPIVFVAFFVLLLLTPPGRSLVFARWRRWAVLALIAFLVFSPLFLHFLLHPQDLLERASGISVFSPGQNQGDFWGLLLRSTLGNMAQFGWRGDGNWVYNIPGRPGLDPIQAALFWSGLVLCLFSWKRPNYLFLPVWWLVMLLPAILAPDPIPHSLRSIGTLPVACLISARMVVVSTAALLSYAPRRRGLLAAVVGVFVAGYAGWAGYTTGQDYFSEWLPRDEVYYAYYGHIADLAETMNQDTDLDAVYIFPVNHDWLNAEYHEYTLELMHRGPVPFAYFVVDDRTVAPELTEICAGKRRVRLVVWTHGNHVDADPRQLLPFHLERAGRRVGREVHRGYRILTYELASEQTKFTAPLNAVEVSAGFGGELGLLARAYGESVPADEPAWVSLRWLVQQQPSADYKASLRLVDRDGHLLGQVDSLLLDNNHRTSGQWSLGQVVTSTHLVPIAPATMPTSVHVCALVYDPQSGRTLEHDGTSRGICGPGRDLGTLDIGRPASALPIEPSVAVDNGNLAAGVDLVGYDRDQSQFNPGESIDIALYWNVTGPVAADCCTMLQLAAPDGPSVVEWRIPPSLSPAQWQAGDQWRDWRTLPLAPDMPPGTYELLIGADSGRTVSLGTVEIRGRARRFDLPALDHTQPVQLGNAIQFLGYDLTPGPVEPGGELEIVLYWQALAPTSVEYTVFVHLLDAQSQIWGQKDSPPGGGEWPTTGWLPGEILTDRYQIPVDPEALPGDYAIEIGMYDPLTGQRLPVVDGQGVPRGDFVLLDSPVVIEP